MIGENNLFDFIKNTIDNKPTIIYFGIGSMFYESGSQDYKDGWEFKENQQFPPFLHDAKLKFFDNNILTILIDPSFGNCNGNGNSKETEVESGNNLNAIPYLVSKSNNFLKDSWTKSNIHSNLFISSFDVSIIVIPKAIKWNDDLIDESMETNQDMYFNIVPLLSELCKYISKPNINSLLFYHEFTGSNVIKLESIIKNEIKELIFDNNKICIDITRGADLSCYFNLSSPENYPLIVLENKLKYLNPSKLSLERKKQIISEYKKHISDITESNNTTTFYLIEKTYDYILFFQMHKIDTYVNKLIMNTIIVTIRQFYTITNIKLFGTKMWAVKDFDKLEAIDETLNFSHIMEILKLFDDINNNIETFENEEHIDTIKSIRHMCLNELDNLLKKSLYYVLFKYDVSEEQIDNYIIQNHKLINKNDMCKIFYEFVNSVMINC